MTLKIPVQLQAAAELELRRRQKERAENCYRCESKALLYKTFDENYVPDPCAHSREEQDINSERNQSYIRQLEGCHPGYVKFLEENGRGNK